MALALGAWAVWFIDRPQGGLVLIRLSLLPAVVGGGFGPPLIGIIAGVTATRDRSHGWQKAGIYRMALARIWPWPIECRGGRLPVVGSGHGVGPLDRVRITSLPEVLIPHVPGLGQQFEFAVRTGVKPDKSAIPTAAHQPIGSGLAVRWVGHSCSCFRACCQRPGRRTASCGCRVDP